MVEYSADLSAACFPFLDKTEALALFPLMDVHEMKAGDILFTIDEPADCLYILLSGRFAVQKETGFGDRMQVVALLDSGAPLGESGLLDGQSRGSTLVAVADSRLLSLSRRAFLEITANMPSLSVKLLSWLMGKLALRLRKNSERLAHVL